MSKLKNQLHKNCRNRNQAFLWHKGKRIYHGVWGFPEAIWNDKRFIAALREVKNLQRGEAGTFDNRLRQASGKAEIQRAELKTKISGNVVPWTCLFLSTTPDRPTRP